MRNDLHRRFSNRLRRVARDTANRNVFLVGCRGGERMTLLDVVCPLVALIALGWLVVCLASLRGEK